MASKETAWSEIIKRIRTIPGVKKVYEGFVDLDSIPLEHYPCIMVEPDFSEPVIDQYDVAGANYCIEVFNLSILIMFKVYQKGKSITGTRAKGVLEWEKALKDKLTEAPKHLDKKVVRVSFGKTAYMRNRPTEIPTRGIIRFVEIEVGLRIKYSTLET